MPSEYHTVQNMFGSNRTIEIEVRHPELGKYQVVRANNVEEAERKARTLASRWDSMWAAIQRTQEAQRALAALESVLMDSLIFSHKIRWENIKDTSAYPIRKPCKPNLPVRPSLPEMPPEPNRAVFQPEFNFLDKIIPSKRAQKEDEAAEKYERARTIREKTIDTRLKKYEMTLAEYKRKLQEVNTKFRRDMTVWNRNRDVFLQLQAAKNSKIDKKKEKYLSGDAETILEYCDMVLDRSQYPSYFPKSYLLHYKASTHMLAVDYQLPPLTSIPTLKEVKYIQSRDEFTEKEISQAQVNRTYDSLLYQITLRTVYELFESDVANALSIVAFNGYVRSIDAATGQEVNACVLSLMVSKEEFEKLNLQSVDPKACFKALKGVGSSKLHSLAPVAPILKIDREDARFVDAYAVVDGIQEGDNLAAMDWEDFEHLIRELFEKEFSGPGSEVKVTRASRDGGIDAVAFDPDPLRGGKIVIQAKRYTNTVGVSAVRDLYGTVVNEGAIKGILVTTADYGPDAYSFAKNKPLTLLNGGNLLHLLEKHGHKAWIDLKEAKKTLNEQKKG